MVDKSITMNANEVLELDYLVEEIDDDSVDYVQNPNNDSGSHISENTHVFNPSGSGTYQLDLNGQIIEIDVIDISTVAQGDLWVINFSNNQEISGPIEFDGSATTVRSTTFSQLTSGDRGGGVMTLHHIIIIFIMRH